MRQHAQALVAHGLEVTVLCGTGQETEPDITVRTCSELRPDEPLPRAASKEQREGRPGESHEKLVQRFLMLFEEHLSDCQTVIVHNVLTMHFNLACTEALWRWTANTRARLIHWTHDLAAINPDYQLQPLLAQPPWYLLTRTAPRFQYVAISETRREEWRALIGDTTSDMPVAPNPLGITEVLPADPALRNFIEQNRILDRDLVVLHPTRVLARKNIELTLRMIAEWRRAGVDAVALITGAPDPYNAASRAYGDQLRTCIETEGLEDAVWFVSDQVALDEASVAALYLTADLLFFPSRQEGFGLPVIEAAWCRTPAAVSDLPVLRELTWPGATLNFSLDEAAGPLASRIWEWLKAQPSFQWRKMTIRRHSMHRIWTAHLQALIMGKGM